MTRKQKRTTHNNMKKLMIMITNASRKEKMVIRSEKQKTVSASLGPSADVGMISNIFPISEVGTR